MIKGIGTIASSPLSLIQNAISHAQVSSKALAEQRGAPVPQVNQGPLVSSLWNGALNTIKTGARVGALAPGLLALSAALGCGDQTGAAETIMPIISFLCATTGFVGTFVLGGLTAYAGLKLFERFKNNKMPSDQKEVLQPTPEVQAPKTKAPQAAKNETSTDKRSYTLRIDGTDKPLHLVHPPRDHHLKARAVDRYEGRVFYDSEKEVFITGENLVAARVSQKMDMVDCRDYGGLVFDEDTGALKGFAIGDGGGPNIAGKSAAEIVVQSSLEVVDQLFQTEIDRQMMQQTFADAEHNLTEALDKDLLKEDLKGRYYVYEKSNDFIDATDPRVAFSTLQVGYIHDNKLYHGLYGNGGVVVVDVYGVVKVYGKDKKLINSVLDISNTNMNSDRLLYEEIDLNEGDTVFAFTDGLLTGRNLNLEVLAAQIVDLLNSGYSIQSLTTKLLDLSNYKDDCFVLGFVHGQPLDNIQGEERKEFEYTVKVEKGAKVFSQEVEVVFIDKYLNLLRQNKWQEAQLLLEEEIFNNSKIVHLLDNYRLLQQNLGPDTPLAVIYALLKYFGAYHNPCVLPETPLYFRNIPKSDEEVLLHEKLHQIRLQIVKILLAHESVPGTFKRAGKYEFPTHGADTYYFEKLFEAVAYHSDYQYVKRFCPEINKRKVAIREILEYYEGCWEEAKKYPSWARSNNKV